MHRRQLRTCSPKTPFLGRFVIQVDSKQSSMSALACSRQLRAVSCSIKRTELLLPDAPIDFASESWIVGHRSFRFPRRPFDCASECIRPGFRFSAVAHRVSVRTLADNELAGSMSH